MVEVAETKYCRYHETEHDKSEFGRDNREPDGLCNICRAARSEIRRAAKKDLSQRKNGKHKEPKVESKTKRKRLDFYWIGWFCYWNFTWIRMCLLAADPGTGYQFIIKKYKYDVPFGFTR